MIKIIFGCIIFFLCLPILASEPIDYNGSPIKSKCRINYTMQPTISYSMKPKVVKPQPKKVVKKEAQKTTQTGYVCDENGCHPVNTYGYRWFRRR